MEKKYDLTAPILNAAGKQMDMVTKFDENGVPIEKRPMTLGNAIETALLATLKSDENLTEAAKADIFKLWLHKICDKKEADFSEQDIQTIKTRASKVFEIMPYGRIYMMLS